MKRFVVELLGWLHFPAFTSQRSLPLLVVFNMVQLPIHKPETPEAPACRFVVIQDGCAKVAETVARSIGVRVSHATWHQGVSPREIFGGLPAKLAKL